MVKDSAPEKGIIFSHQGSHTWPIITIPQEFFGFFKFNIQLLGLGLYFIPDPLSQQLKDALGILLLWSNPEDSDLLQGFEDTVLDEPDLRVHEELILKIICCVSEIQI